jgi:hypothetical protein
VTDSLDSLYSTALLLNSLSLGLPARSSSLQTVWSSATARLYLNGLKLYAGAVPFHAAEFASSQIALASRSVTESISADFLSTIEVLSLVNGSVLFLNR